jgi:hypothetical protein
MMIAAAAAAAGHGRSSKYDSDSNNDDQLNKLMRRMSHVKNKHLMFKV